MPTIVKVVFLVLKKLETMKKYLSSIFKMDRFILSPQEFKREVLISRLSTVLMITLVLFIAIDIWNGFLFPIPFHLLGLLILTTILFLNKRGYFMSARVLLTVLVNCLVIFFAAVLPRELGLYTFSICINISVMMVYGFERIKLSLTICTLSFCIFSLAVFHPYDRFINEIITADFIKTNLMFGLVISTGVSISVMYLLLQANYKTESILLLKEKALTIKNDELVKLNSELDKFFYSASHDLRAPLSSILGLIQFMEQTQDEKELKSYIPMLKGRAKNLEGFIKGVAEYTTNSSKTIQYQNVFLHDIIRENLENLRFYPHASEIKIVFDVPRDLQIMSEPISLQVILGNLLSNAIKYHDFEKPNRYIKVSANVNGESVIISIQDNGKGIKKDDLVNIFNMFYRADNSVEGTGIGLHIVKEAVEKIGGSIEVNSIYGEGTTFKINLPTTYHAVQPLHT